VKPEKDENGIFSSDKPKNIPKFWYPLIIVVIFSWITFSLFVVK
jgi:ABC-type microcin C transport system permease subunit YejE